MKNSIKVMVASVIAGSFIATSVGVSFAQTYTPTYNQSYQTNSTPGASYNLNNNYNAQSYQTNGYQQPAQPVNTYQQPTYPQANNYQKPTNYSQNGYSQPTPATPVNGYTQSSTYQPNQNYLPPLQGRVVTVPVGSNVSAVTQTEISSENLTEGDSVSIVLGHDFYFNGVLIAPANSAVNGNVVIAQKAGRAGKNGQLKIRFTNIVTPYGQRIPISGKIATEDGTGILKGGTSKQRAMTAVKNTAVGGGVGALTGVIFGPLSGGKAGKGAATGTAVGAGLGLGKTLLDKGKDVIIAAGNRINIILDQPLTVTPNQSNNY